MPKKKAEKTEDQTQEKKTAEAPKKLSQLEFEKEVIELAEKGLTSEKIGETLRKKGIHPKDSSKKISKILKDKNLYVNPDLKNIEAKLKKVSDHYGKNKADRRAMRERERIFSQLKRAKEYNHIPIK